MGTDFKTLPKKVFYKNAEIGANAGSKLATGKQYHVGVGYKSDTNFNAIASAEKTSVTISEENMTSVVMERFPEAGFGKGHVYVGTLDIISATQVKITLPAKYVGKVDLPDNAKWKGKINVTTTTTDFVSSGTTTETTTTTTTTTLSPERQRKGTLVNNILDTLKSSSDTLKNDVETLKEVGSESQKAAAEQIITAIDSELSKIETAVGTLLELISSGEAVTKQVSIIKNATKTTPIVNAAKLAAKSVDGTKDEFKPAELLTVFFGDFWTSLDEVKELDG